MGARMDQIAGLLETHAAKMAGDFTAINDCQLRVTSAQEATQSQLSELAIEADKRNKQSEAKFEAAAGSWRHNCRPALDPTGGQIDFLGRDFRVKQSTPWKIWGFVDMETTNKHAKTQKYTRVLARRSQLFFSRAQMGFLGDSGCVTSSKQAVGAAFPAA